MAIYDRVCRTCGVSFRGGPRAWYCPDCRRERKKETDRKVKHNGPTRPIGSTDLCENCGKEYTVDSGLQKYCPKCQPIMHRRIDNEQGTAYYHNIVDKTERSVKRRAYYAAHKDEINRRRRAKNAEKKKKTK